VEHSYKSTGVPFSQAHPLGKCIRVATPFLRPYGSKRQAGYFAPLRLHLMYQIQQVRYMPHTEFMTTFYFFVPINSIKKCKIRTLERGYSYLQCPEIYQSLSSICCFAELKEWQQKFYYKAYPWKDKKNDKVRQISLKVYLIKYIPSVADDTPQYFFAIGTGIDKRFSLDEDDPICTEMDLVMLKRAFYSANDKTCNSTGLYFPKQDPTIFHRNWLEKLVKSYDSTPNDVIAFVACITDIIGASVQSDSEFSTFEDSFYHSIPQYYNRLLGAHTVSFAYGLIVGNENYRRLPAKQIQSFENTAYSNSLTECTFCVPTNILFFRTHYPFIHIQEEEDCHLHFNISDLDIRHIYIMCHSLYLT